MVLEPIPGETKLMIQLKTVILHRVHRMNCGDSGFGIGIVPSINPTLCFAMREMIIDLVQGK